MQSTKEKKKTKTKYKAREFVATIENQKRKAQTLRRLHRDQAAKKARTLNTYQSEGWKPGPVVKAHAKAKTIIIQRKEMEESVDLPTGGADVSN